MAAQERPKNPKKQELPKERVEFRALLSVNPNYFGSLEKVPFKPIMPKALDTTFEELICVGYNPRRAELEATLVQKRGGGYGGGGPCSAGSREYVRFYVDDGSGWADKGLAGVRVNDLTPRDDCVGKSTHPLSHTLTVPYAPLRRPCTNPRFVRVRAILSWNHEPPADTPHYRPPWGSVLECTVQIEPRRKLFLQELAAPAELVKLLKLPEQLMGIIEQPIPVPPPTPPTLKKLAARYAGDRNVPPSRFAFAAAMEATSARTVTASSLQETAKLFEDVDLDLSKVLEEIGKTARNVHYEELECVGLDNARERLVATFRVKQSSGYSGLPCDPGSKEYVAFWADWDDTCEWTYLGTAEVVAHDFADLPEGGLCYSAVLPVDLDPLRLPCKKPRLGRIRATLSWNMAPPPDNPEFTPIWGNRVDTHVRVLPGVPGGTDMPWTWITLIGGINASASPINSGISMNGVTTSKAVFADLGVMADPGRPFGGWIVVRGPSFPGHEYRLFKRQYTPGASAPWSPMTASFQCTNEDATLGQLVTPLADGTVEYVLKENNFTNLLGRFRPTVDGLWEIRMEVIGKGYSTIYRVRVDNTAPTAHVSITSPGGNCGKFTVGSTIKGKFDVGDVHLRRWTLRVLDPDLSDTLGVNPIDPAAGTTAMPSGTDWKLDTTGMRACGYNVLLQAWDWTIRDSHDSAGNSFHTQVGFCLE